MKKWIISGYSGKYDGFLYVVEAESEDKALLSIRSGDDEKIFRFEHDGGKYDILGHKDMTIDELKEQIDSGSDSRIWYLGIQELSIGSNHPKAVLW